MSIGGNFKRDMAQNNKKGGQCKEKVSPKKSDNNPRKFYSQLVFRDWCKACGICAAFCPKKVIGRNESGEPVIERPDECIGCRFCETHCPDFAITIVERDKSIEAKNNG